MATAARSGAAPKIAQDRAGRPSKPRSTEEAIFDVLARVGAAGAAVGACLATAPVWGPALGLAYGHRLLRRCAPCGQEWKPAIALACTAAVGLAFGWQAGLSPLGLLDLSAGAGRALWAGATLPTGMPADRLAALLADYGRGAWPYAVAWSPAAGALLLAADRLLRFASPPLQGSGEERSGLRLVDAARVVAEPTGWLVANAVGRRLITLLSAPPGAGKGWLLWGLARASQDGAPFFGLRVPKIRIAWLTEEPDTSFTATRERFGVGEGVVYRLPSHQVRGWEWPDLVRWVRRTAWRRGCALVVFDTVRAWCPEAEKSPEAANAVMAVVRRELAEPGLAALFVHHNHKGGGLGPDAELVAGTNGLVGAVDVLAQLLRVSKDPADTRRRLVTSRRVERPLDLTASLDGHTYVLLPTGEQKAAAWGAVLDAVRRGDLPPAPARVCATVGCGKPAAQYHHRSYAPGRELDVTPLCADCHAAETADPAATLRQTVETIRAAGGQMGTEAFREALGIKGPGASKRLAAAVAAGRVECVGGGGRLGPKVWRLRDPDAHADAPDA